MTPEELAKFFKQAKDWMNGKAEPWEKKAQWWMDVEDDEPKATPIIQSPDSSHDAPEKEKV